MSCFSTHDRSKVVDKPRDRSNAKVRTALASIILLLGSGVLSPTFAGVQASYYVSPGGAGSACSYSAPCSIAGAQTKVRTVNSSMTGDIQVVLLGGTYTLTSPIQFVENGTTHDSGTNGFDVIYMNNPGDTVMISGGTSITGFALWQNGIYRAAVSSTFATRQLYVNGRRAIRARSDLGAAGFTMVSDGFTTASPAPDLSTAANVSDIEVYLAGNVYAISRCKVSSITATGGGATHIVVDPVCWNSSATQTIRWIENALPLLTRPGEWYLDKASHYLYYKPRPGEVVNTTPVIAPVLQQLVVGTGASSTPLRHIRFQGLTFAYATWLWASDTGINYAEIEDNFRVPQGTSWDYTEYGIRTPANLSFTYANNIRFERDTFAHLGSVGLEFLLGSQDNAVTGSVFQDISGSGIQFGEYGPDYHHPDNPAKIVKNNLVADSFFSAVAQEYTGGVAISASYTEGSVFSHNEIFDVPYSGIWLGAGHGYVDPNCSSAPFPNPTQWAGYCLSYTTATPAKSNRVEWNTVHDIVAPPMSDGGAIYTEDNQPDSLVHHNYSYAQHNNTGVLYLDAGTQNVKVYDNVVRQMYGPTSNWLYIQYPYQRPSQFDKATNNWIDNNTYYCGDSSNTCSPNTLVTGNWPTAAQAVMTSSGIDAAYVDIIPNEVYTVGDNVGISVPQNGIHGGIDWGTNKWKRDDSYTGYTSEGYAYYYSPTTSSASFTLPAGTRLVSVKLEGPGTYTMADGVNSNVTGSLSGVGIIDTIATGWTSGGSTVTLSFPQHDAVVIDEVVFGKPAIASPVVYSFTDVSGMGVALNGTHGGIGFGTGVWEYEDGYSGYALQRYGFFATAATSASFTLPAGKVLNAIKLEGPGTYTIADGVNPSRSGTLSNAGNVDTITTGWTTSGTVVTLTLTGSNAVVVDDILYGAPPASVTYSFDDMRGITTALNGIHGGIDFGSGSWVTDHLETGLELTTYGWFSANVTSRSFTLPLGRKLSAVTVEGPSGSTYTISDGTKTKTGSLLGYGTPIVVTTGWASNNAVITVSCSTGWTMVIDDIKYN